MLHTLSSQHAYFPLDVKALVNLSSHCFSSLMKMCFSFFKNAIFTQKILGGGGGLRLYHSFIPSFFSPFAYQHIDIFYLYTEITGLLSSFQSSTSTLISALPLPKYSSVFDFFLYLSSTGIFMT